MDSDKFGSFPSEFLPEEFTLVFGGGGGGAGEGVVMAILASFAIQIHTLDTLKQVLSRETS